MLNPRRQLRDGEVQRIANATHKDQHDANTIIVALLMRLGGGATLHAEEFVEAERRVRSLECKGEHRPGGTVMHFRVRV